MDTVNESKGIYWLMFIVSTIACIFLMIYADEWFWVTFPFIGTGLAKALDAL